MFEILAHTFRTADPIGSSNKDALRDAVSALLSSKNFWIMQSIIVAGAAASGWLLARASADSSGDPPPLLPRFSPTESAPTHGYGSTTAARPPAYSNVETISLQAQLRDARDHIATLEAKVASLSTPTWRIEGDVGQVNALRAEARVNNSKLEALRTQAQTREQTIGLLNSRNTMLSRSLRDAEGEVARLSALAADAHNSDSIILSLDAKLDALREQARGRENTIITLENRIYSLMGQLERAEGLAGAQEPHIHTPEPLTVSQCGRCTPPAHMAGKARAGHWLRNQAKALQQDAGKIFFEVLNPDLVGPRATLRDGMRIDLHNQYRDPAVGYAENYATSARSQGFDKIIFIVGKGLHSEDNIAKLRPAVLEKLKSLNMEAHSPPNNLGEIVVKLQKRVD